MNRELFLYGRNQCELCQQMHNELQQWSDENDITVYMVNIEGDLELTHRYGARLPVLAAGDREICELKLDHAALESFLSSI